MANVATPSAAPSSASPATSSAAPATRHSWVIDHSPFFYGWVILAAGSLGAAGSVDSAEAGSLADGVDVPEVPPQAASDHTSAATSRKMLSFFINFLLL